MRVVLRILAPVLGLGMAAVGAVLVAEVVAAWFRSTGPGLLVPWSAWQTAVEDVRWREPAVPLVALAVAVLGLLLVLVGLLARRNDIVLSGRGADTTVTTSPRELARLVGRRVRAADNVAAASITATARKVHVRATGWDGAGPELRETVHREVDGLLDELALARRPRVTVTVEERRAQP
jgi:hypothetical protein